MKIYSKYENTLEGKKRGEVPNPETPYYVDCVGFISMEQQIKGLINAGINLENYRRSQYDYQISNSEADIDIDSVDVSVENQPDFMPSVDMLNVVDSVLNPISPVGPLNEPTTHVDESAGVTTPVEPTDAS